MADDDEIQAIRAKRLAELQAQYGGGKQQDQEQKEEAQRRHQDMKNAMLAQILEQSARARLSSIALVKPEKAELVENMLIRMAQTGQIHGKLGEAELIKLLEQVNQTQAKKTTVKFDRRKLDDSDED
ncbi:programmed cell death protein 5-like [Gigantopelta aegis]|uniref:programmed cell death protein 5-like n=1 Tax=Gigantopelta aegis TaxID=1735272 RepID=UPI001B88E1EE|nr:programmed cell death protein 5-like [Gigantopelta aegis]